MNLFEHYTRLVNDYLGEGRNFPEALYLISPSDEVSLYSGAPLNPGEVVVLYERKDFSSRATLVDQAAPIQVYTAEEWLAHVGYTPLRLLTCLDLERKLSQAQLISPKLEAARVWIDQITIMAAPNPDLKRGDWPSPPYPFVEASGEALLLLSGNP